MRGRRGRGLEGLRTLHENHQDGGAAGPWVNVGNADEARAGTATGSDRKAREARAGGPGAFAREACGRPPDGPRTRRHPPSDFLTYWPIWERRGDVNKTGHEISFFRARPPGGGAS